jgi:hypothetical protein
MNSQDTRFFPLTVVERWWRPLLLMFAGLLLVASIWSLVNQWTRWDRPVELLVGAPGPVEEVREGGRVRYRLPFIRQDNGEEMMFWARNHSPVLDYLSSEERNDVVALRYWTDDRVILEVHPLVYGIAPIRDRVPPSGVLVGTSVLGLILAAVLVFPGQVDRALYRLGRRSRSR